MWLSRRPKVDNDLFLPKGYITRSEVKFFNDFNDAGLGLIWQPDVYRLAASISMLHDRHKIVDVGCGSAAKLLQLDSRIETIGFDHPIIFEKLAEVSPDRTWFPIELDRKISLRRDMRRVFTDSTVVCSDVVEHLLSPQHLLEMLHKIRSRSQCLIMSTPDRIKNWGGDHIGPPPNPAHVQEWTLQEFGKLLDHFGLSPINIGYTVNNDRDREWSTIVAVIPGGRSDLRNDDYSRVFYSMCR